MADRLKDIISYHPNPYNAKQYVITLSQEITISDRHYSFSLRYIPDRLVITPASLKEYLEKLLTITSSEYEILAHDILEDIIDQIIPKWIEVNLHLKENEFGQSQLVTMEDRQPNWEDIDLIRRLPPIS